LGRLETLASALLALSLSASPAKAEPSSAKPPSPTSFGARNSLSFSFFSLFGPGLTVEYERYLRPPALSFVSGLGFRTTGGSEYTTLTLTSSFEGRLWLGNMGPWRSADRRMTGPLLSLRGDVAWTSVEDDRRERLVGTAVEIAETLSLGYRFLLFRVHATPLLGATVTTQLDPRGHLAPITFVSGKLAITFGVLF
jgi:hypothetical protein